VYKNSETTKVIMEQEKVIREEGILDEQIDVAWANTTAADLARRSSDLFASGNTKEGLKFAQQAEEAAKLVEAIHDLYHIARIGRQRLGLPEFFGEANGARIVHLQTTETTEEQASETEQSDPLGLNRLQPAFKNTLVAIEQLVAFTGRPVSKEDIAIHLGIKPSTVGGNIYRINLIATAEQLPFTIRSIPQTVPEGHRGKPPVKHDISITAKNSDWIANFRESVRGSMPELAALISPD